VLFLDIQMPGMNGFELLSRLTDQPFVIFTTAYDQYALRAFEVNSIDYLLKPIDPSNLREQCANSNARDQFRSRSGSRTRSYHRCWPSGCFAASERTEYPRRIASPLASAFPFSISKQLRTLLRRIS